jgi:Lrp/AsnC family transcriptional regulator for asnA, asnC and gidA
MSLDEIDMSILQLLQNDSSTPYVEIAEKIGVTDGTIHQRVKKLKDSGIITGFTVTIDQNLLGEGTVAYVLVTVNPGVIEQVSEEVCSFSKVLEVHEVHTRGDLLLKIRASDQEEVRNIIVNKIRKIDGVVDSELLPVYKSWKEEPFPPIDQRVPIN